MRTTIRTSKSQPAIKAQSPRGLARSRGTSQPPGRRPRFFPTSADPAAKGPTGVIGRRSQSTRPNANPATKGPSGLIGRARTSLPGRKPPSKKSPLNVVLSSLDSAKNNALARKPSKKGAVAIMAGGLGVAAVANRRRGAVQDETPATSSVKMPGAGDAEEGSLTALPGRPDEPSPVSDSPPTPSPVQPEEPGRAEDIPPAG